MKINLKYNQMPLISLLCGILGALLRLWLYATGIDESGLLVPVHFAGILLSLLCLATVGITLWVCRKFPGQGKYSGQFPASTQGGIGAFAGGVCLLLTSMLELVRREAFFSVLTGVFGIVATAALLFTGLCRLKGLRPHWGFHSVVCLYFVIRLIGRYQVWSSDPQLSDYCFQLLATVCAMLFSYHRAALDMKATRRRRMVILGLLGGFFCCLSVTASDTPLLYAGLAVWMLTNLGTLDFNDPIPAEEN